MLYHFSEKPDIKKFAPRPHPSDPEKLPMVWAIDNDRAPLYYFPRECPRIGYWATADSTIEDIRAFLGHTEAEKVLAVEAPWFDKIANTELYIYHLPENTFKSVDDGAGYYTSPETITPEFVERAGNLTNRLLNANVELRITPSLIPLQDALVSSTLHFSMIRMRNANL